MSTERSSKYFKNIQEELERLGFEGTSLPWRMESSRLSIVQVKDESELYPEVNPTLYSIESKRYQDCIYRGKLPDIETLNLILELTYEL